MAASGGKLIPTLLRGYGEYLWTIVVSVSVHDSLCPAAYVSLSRRPTFMSAWRVRTLFIALLAHRRRV